jgi:hydroxylysine kinase
MQTEALLHLEAKATDLPVPRIFPALSGATEIGLAFEDGSARTVRLLSYLEGTPLHTVGPSAALLRDLGHCAGRLARGLRDFAHTGVRHKLLWDLQHAGELRPLVDAVSHQQRGAVEDVLGRFEMHALPVLAGLDRQAVHNDLNPHNIVVDPNRGDRIAGIIDFGDLAFTARINDLAIAAAYQVADGDDPLEPACELIAAYHQVSPLDPVERDILFDLIATRIVMTIVIASFRAVRHPENRVYILRNYQGALVRLGRIARLSRNEARLQIARACRSE